MEATGSAEPAWSPRGTTLITGGTGTLGAHVARHLAARGADHLLLVSRRGADAPGAGALADELASLGAHRVTVEACDVADRDAVAALLASVPADQPLRAVAHTAAVLDDALIGSLDRERVANALRVKADGARHLDELTRGLDLDAFVLFSSLAGICGTAGQANYAPGNAYLDALAAHRRGLGLPATSVAWGYWADGGIASADTAEELARVGLAGMAAEPALRSLDRVLAADATYAVVADADWAVLDAARPWPHPLLGDLPALRSRSSASRRDRAGSPGSPGRPGHAGEEAATVQAQAATLAARVAQAAPAECGRLVADVVLAEAASVLGRASAAGVDPGSAFGELGFDSLAAVRFRNRLSALAGITLPASLVYDHPTPRAVAAYLAAKLAPAPAATAAPDLLATIGLLEETTVPELLDGSARRLAAKRLTALAARLSGGVPGAGSGVPPTAGAAHDLAADLAANLADAGGDDLLALVSQALSPN